MALHELDDLIGGSEVARMAGLTTAAVCNWAKRKSDDVPKPIVTPPGASGPLYSRTAVAEWLMDRADEREKRRQARIEALKAELLELEGANA